MDRAISLAVCSQSASENEYSGFISRLKNRHKIGVKYVSLSSHNQLEDYDFSHFDAVVLIHSISRGRLSITDVNDAQYGKFLPRICDQFGKDRVAVLVHGMQDPKTLEKAFESVQPTTMKCSSWVKLCTDLLQNDVDDMMEALLSKLDKCPKPTLHSPKSVQAVSSEDKAVRQVNKVTVQTATFKGVGGKLDIPGINLIICAEGCTRDSILQSLCQTKVNKIFLCTVFEETNDTWKHIQVNQMSRAGPTSGSSPYLRALLFIYRDRIPPEFNDDTRRELLDIQTGIGDTKATLVEVGGTTDERCVSDILHIASSSRMDRVTQIVSVTPRMGKESSDAYHKADGLSFQLIHGKISRAELEYQMEEDQKEQKRSQIRKLENEVGECESELRNLKGETRSLEKVKQTCSDKVRRLQENIEKLKEQTFQLSSKCDAEKERAEDFSKKADILENTIRAKKKVLEELDKVNNSLQGVIEETVEKNSQKMKEIKEKERKHTEKCQTIDRQLSEQREQVNRDCEASKRDLGLAEKQTEKLRAEYTKLKTELKVLESDGREKRSILETSLDYHEKKLSEDKKNGEAEKQNIQREIEQLRNELEQFKSIRELQSNCKQLESLFQTLEENIQEKEEILKDRRRNDENIKNELSRIKFDGKRSAQKMQQIETKIEELESAFTPLQAEKAAVRSVHAVTPTDVKKTNPKSKNVSEQWKTLSERANQVQSKLSGREEHDNEMIDGIHNIKATCKDNRKELQISEEEIGNLHDLCKHSKANSNILNSKLKEKKSKLALIKGNYDLLKDQVI